MTITPLSSTSSSRWAELAPARTAEAKEREPKTVHKTERSEAEREGPRRSPLFGAIKAALEDLVAQAGKPAATSTTDRSAETVPADGGTDSEALEQAIAGFARALMQALREGRGSPGEGRGRHHGWDSAAQRVEKLAREFAPATENTQAKPVEAATQAATEVAADQAETVPATETTASPVTVSTMTTSAGTPAVSLRLTLELTLAESPWKSAHDGLIESFAAVQRAVGRADNGSDDDKSLEEQLREMLVALAAKLRTTAVNTAALAPTGSLLSVVA